MNTKQWIGLGASLLLMTSCGNDNEMDIPTSYPEATAFPISCSAHAASAASNSRTLIDGDTQAERDAALQAACTPGTGGDAIAIYGSYTPNSGGDATTVFDNTALVYDASVGTNDETNRINWNYANEQYWTKEATYDFRACYPQGLLTGSPASLSGTYNTLTQQKDLMVAYTQVNTLTTPSAMGTPVPLEMHHALAAVSFKVQSEDGSDMTLASLSLNDLYTVGTFTYDYTGATPTPLWTDWSNRHTRTSYEWSGNLAFNNETLVTHYSATGLGTYATDGYILVIPQTCRPTLDLSTTKKTYNTASLHTAEGVTYEPGKKYTYTITVSPAEQLIVTLSIKPWNNLNSSYDFSFE